MQDVASGGTTEDSMLVLQALLVDVLEVEALCRLLVRPHVILGERPAHARWVVVALVCVVDGESQEAGIAILRGNGAAQVGSESGNAAMTGEIITDYRDPTGQGNLRVRPRPRRCYAFRHQGSRAHNLQKSLGR